jgi:lysophospholipase L1-like esterase
MSDILRGKKIVNFGDSIFGNFRAPTDISSHLARITGAEVYNVGFGGCRMSEHLYPHFDRFSMYRLAYSVTTRDFSLQDESFSYEPIGEALPAYFSGSLELLKSIDFSKVDIATIAYGTNDYTSERKLEGEGRYDTTAFGGAMRYSIERLREAYPNLKIAVCSQTYRFWRDKEGNFTNDSATLRCGENTLLPFLEKTKEIADEYGLYYIDNYYGSGICYDNRNECFSETDGTHPIEYGRILLAENIARELERMLTV